MIYSAVKTPELGSDLQQIADLFNRVFDKHASADSLQNKYQSPHLGHSFHGLMKQESRVVGALTVIPRTYNYFGEERIFGNAVDLMIDPEARSDLFSFKKIYDVVMELVGDRVDLVYAVPNSNSYLYFRKFLKWQDIGDLHYYVLPVNIGSLKPGFGWLNPCSRIGSWLWSALPRTSSATLVTREIRKSGSESFYAHRFAQGYESGAAGNSRFYYRLFQEESTQVCYIVDIEPLSARSVDAAASYVRQTTSCDAIIYIDIVKMSPHKSIRVPKKQEPRNLQLVAKTVTERVDDRIFEPSNWQFNLSDFDAR